MTLREAIQQQAPAAKAVILVTGPYAAGKSTFIATISEQLWAEPKQHEYKLMALYSLGCIDAGDDAALLLLESPGARRFDTVMEDAGLTEPFAGIVVVMNSAAPETFREVKSILDTFRAHPEMSHVLAVGHQDHPDAWTIADLRTALREPACPLMPCIATDCDSVKRVLLVLFEHLPDNRIVQQAAAKFG